MLKIFHINFSVSMSVTHFFLVKSVSTFMLIASSSVSTSNLEFPNVKLFSPSLVLSFNRSLHYYSFCCLLTIQSSITTGFLGNCETFPVKAHSLPLHLFATCTPFDCYNNYRTLNFFVAFPSNIVSNAVSICWTRDLPQTSFRFHLTMDTLSLIRRFPFIRISSGLKPVRVCPC